MQYNIYLLIFVHIYIYILIYIYLFIYCALLSMSVFPHAPVVSNASFDQSTPFSALLRNQKHMQEMRARLVFVSFLWRSKWMKGTM